MLKVELIGNLGADAEVKESNGSKFVTMRIAHSFKRKLEDGRESETTIWVDATMSDTESKVIPYLRQGVKVFVRGNADLRVYSSPKDRCMKAGLSVRVWEIELVGGQSEDVPRQLINPEDATLIDVSKHYWCGIDTKGINKDEFIPLVDAKGREYRVDKGGFIHPVVGPLDSDSETQNAES